MIGGSARYCRPRCRQRHASSDLGHRWFTYVPLAHAVALATLGKIEMDMRFMMAVGTGPEHGGETVARTLTYFVPEFLGDSHIRKTESAAVSEYKRAYIDRVAFAVLAELGAGHPVAAAAFEIIVGLNRAQNRAEFAGSRRRFVTHPAGDGFGKRAAQHRRRFEFDMCAASERHRLEPDHVVAAASIRTDQPRYRFDDSGRLKALVAVGGRARDVNGIEISAGGFAEGLRFDPQRRTRPGQRHGLGGCNAAASGSQPQERNQ